MYGRILHVALFLIGLFGTAYGIDRADILPFWSWARSNMGTAASELAEADTVFFGSSRISYGVIPDAFDARARELGHPTRSFNAALSGTWPHEFEQVCLWLLQHPHPALRRVVIELQSWDKPCEGNWMSDQEVELHGIRNLPDRLATVWSGKTSRSEKAWRTYFHVMHSLANFFRVGQGPRILDDVVARVRGGAPNFYRAPEHGYICVEALRNDYFAKRHAEFVDGAAQHDESLATKAKNPDPEFLRGGFRFGPWRELDLRLRAAGIEPIYVVMPSFSLDFHGRDMLPELSRLAKVLVYDLPQANPGLFDHARWFDTTHLNRTGATMFSRLLAEAILPEGPPEQGSSGPSMRSSAVWAAGESPTIELRVEDAPEGDVLAVVSSAPADLDLGNGMHARVALPALAHAALVRDGRVATARLSGSQLPANAPLYVQFAVVRAGSWVAVSDRIDLPARR